MLGDSLLLTAIELFEQLAQHLLTQKVKCSSKTGKPKSIAKDLKCPTGTLLPKGVWNKAIDRKGIFFPGLPEKLNLSTEQQEIVEIMQSIHDVIIPEKWADWIDLYRDNFFTTKQNVGDV